MNKDVSIRIAGVHGRGADRNTVVSECKGMYFEKNDKKYIKYSETDSESGEVRNSLIVIDGHNVTVEHKGHTDAKMIYEIGNTTRSMYVTPAGSMLLEIFTRGIDIEERGNRLSLSIDYEMGFGDGEKEPARIVIEAKN
ncbi:MAG: DUF1934 domain-containing protein [Lachnospiraceae bacterium]|nr:DUF1934 domain-containing protein [Lachnospiraceae bacterium]